MSLYRLNVLFKHKKMCGFIILFCEFAFLDFINNVISFNANDVLPTPHSTNTSKSISIESLWYIFVLNKDNNPLIYISNM